MKHVRATLILVCALALPGRAPADDFGDMFSVMFRMMLTMMNVMSNAMDDDGWGNNWGGWGNNWSNWGSMPYGSAMTSWPLWSGMSGMGGWPGMSPWSSLAGIPGMSPWSGLGGIPGMSPWTGLGGLSGITPWSGAGGWPRTAAGISPWSGPLAGNAWSSPFTGAINPTGIPGYGSPVSRGIPGGSPLDGRWYGSTGEILELRGNSFRLQNAATDITGGVRVTGNLISLYSPQTGTSTRYTFVSNGDDLLLQDGSGQVISFHKNPINGALHIF